MTQMAKTGPGKLWLSFILFLALLAASCASTGGGGDEKKLGESLKLSVEAFNSAFRWEEYKEAAAFVPSGKKEQFWAEVDGFKGKIRIVEYTLRDVDLKDKNCSASVIMYFQFWRLEQPTLQTVTFTQKWYFVQKDKQGKAGDSGWKVSDSGFGAMLKARARF
jgi:hypothetical protein